jgi:hypothetical protein
MNTGSAYRSRAKNKLLKSYETIIRGEMLTEKETRIYYTILMNDQRYADDCRLYS